MKCHLGPVDHFTYTLTSYRSVAAGKFCGGVGWKKIRSDRICFSVGLEKFSDGLEGGGTIFRTLHGLISEILGF